MNLCADRLIAIIIVEAFKDEMRRLREWYFCESKHSDFNAFYYEFLEAVNKPHISLEEQVEVCYQYYIKAVGYMNVFYPDTRMDVDLLSFDMDNPYYPAILVNTPPLPSQRKHRATKQAMVNSKSPATGKKRGRPKGSKKSKRTT